MALNYPNQPNPLWGLGALQQGLTLRANLQGQDLAREGQRIQLAELARQAQMQGDTRNFLRDAFTPEQPFSQQGPYAGGMERPPELTRQPMAQPEIYRGLMGLGNYEAAQQFAPKAPPSPYEGLETGYETYLRANQLLPTEQSYRDYQDRVLEQKRAGATQVNVNSGETPGRKEIDKTFAKEFVDYLPSGGFADTMKQIGQIDAVIAKLENSDNLTGTLLGNLPMGLRTAVAPESVAAQEAVEEVVQRNLRLVLGAQFTAQEGERLIARAYNPRLSEEKNAERLRRLSNQMKAAARAKASAAKYFQENGTLTGWNGRLPSIEDFSLPPVPGEKEETQTGIKFLGFE